MKKVDEILSKIKAHPIYSFFAIVLLICFLFYTYTHPLNKHKIPRTALPETSMPTGTLALITEPDQGTAPVLRLIQNAKSSVDLVMYEFEDKQVGDALIAAAKRGVNVRVLVNKGYQGQESKTNQPAYVYLQNHAITVHFTPSYFALTHQKTMIIDHNKACIMTFNMVPKYYPTERDFGIIDTDQSDVNDIEKTFTADFDAQKIIPTNGDDLVWSPGSEDDTLLLIESAKKELDIYNEEMQDKKIITALSTAVKNGVQVNVLMTYQSSFKSALNKLKAAGVTFHLFHGEKGLYIHAKMIIADRSYGFLGSENFSYGSLSQNRELGIFLSDKTVLNSLLKTFSTDWQNAKLF